METTLSHQIKVGIFTVAGLFLFCLSVVLLGGDKFFLTRTYSLRIRMAQVQGIDRGSVVSLVGVPIGNVSGVSFIPGSSDVEVTITVQRSVQPRISEGSKASIKTQGALGDKYVYIQPGPVGNPPIPAGSELPVDKPPDIIDILAAKGAELGEVVEMFKEVRNLFANMNRDDRSGKLMANLVTSSDQLTKFLVEGRDTFKFMRQDALVPMANVMRKLDSNQGTLGALINDPSLHNRVMSLLGEAPRTKFLKPLIRDSIQTSEEKTK